MSLDPDVVVGTQDLGRVEELLRCANPEVTVTRIPHSLNVGMPDSDLRVQFRMDPRYQSFIGRAERRVVVGLPMPVAAIEDVLRGKVWAAQDRDRRPSKRQKDLADVARLLEARQDLRSLVPEEVLDILLHD